MVQLAHFDDVFQLFARHVSISESHAQSCLMDHRCERGRVGREKDALALDAVGDAVLDLWWGQLRDGLPEDQARIVDGLEQAWDVGDLGRADRRRMVFEFGQVEESEGRVSRYSSHQLRARPAVMAAKASMYVSFEQP